MAPRTVYYFCHHRGSLIQKHLWRTPLCIQRWIVPNACSSSTRPKSSLQTKIMDRVNEKATGMQDMKLSPRLQLIRPGNTQGWPYSVDPARVLVIFLPWLRSKEKHVSKYVQLYLDLGLDVLCFKSKTMDFLWPPSSFDAAQELSEILKQCKHYDHYLFHTMSVGSYNFTTFRVLAKDVQEVSELNKKVCGIIYDSIVIGAGRGGVLDKSKFASDEDDETAINKFITGIASSVSKSKIYLSAVSVVSKIYFSMTKKKTLDYYEKAYDVVRDEPLNVPTLLVTSRNDPMSDPDVVEKLVEIWKDDHNIPVTLHIWEKSGHAQHLVLHRKEYIDLQRKLLDDVFSELEKDEGMNTRSMSKL